MVEKQLTGTGKTGLLLPYSPRCSGLHAIARLFLLALSLSLLATGTSAQEPAQAPAGVNAITKAFVNSGALACASRINQITNYVGFSDKAGAVLMIPPVQPDRHLSPIAMEVPTEQGVAYVSANFAPNQANGCGASYDAVLYWPQRCHVIEDKHFSTFKNIGKMKDKITVLDGGPRAKVFLMPAGKGCVSIKKEVAQ